MKGIKLFPLAFVVCICCSNLFYHDIDSTPDSEPVIQTPVVDSIIPGNDQNDVALNRNPVVYFSCEIDATTITDETVILEKIDETGFGRERVQGSLTVYNNGIGVVMFHLPEGIFFEAQKKYCVTVKRGVRSIYGKILEDDFQSFFNTGGTLDSDPPVLDYISPEYLVNAENSLKSFDIRINFNEALKSESLRNIEIVLSNSNPDFNTKIFTEDFVMHDPRRPNIIVVRLDFNRALVPPGEYHLELCRPSDIEDLAGNSFSGTIEFSISYLVSYKHPCYSPCFTSDKGKNCCR
ncbi:MAG TPA: Ig-like domain-containing protein [Spirochaetota bacterium]|nr:Ig-like domain-containing protein [Spirochaetota bacterium]HPI90399.1 Ig-like domain-containing protein [Spirochaetota bacterium]HPR48518.1 Ig-like domain-containing protein [Spirochaetota bacterium]